MFAIEGDVDRDKVRGANELCRRSTVYRARPILRLFGRTVWRGQWQVIVEDVHQFIGAGPAWSSAYVSATGDGFQLAS